MIDLYRELGFEVAAGPVVTGGLVEGCATCFGGGGDEYRSIYTRRPANGPRKNPRSRRTIPRASCAKSTSGSSPWPTCWRHVLFTMADQLVTGPACTMLCQAYDGTGDATFGGCSKAELEELGREIVG